MNLSMAQPLVTTLMFRKLPRHFDNTTLLSEIDTVVGPGLVDFLLLGTVPSGTWATRS